MDDAVFVREVSVRRVDEVLRINRLWGATIWKSTEPDDPPGSVAVTVAPPAVAPAV